jgi:hypothetical protein
MNHEPSGDPTRPEYGPESPFPIQSSAVERAAEFLTQGSSNRERLGCADCLTAELCAAAVTELAKRDDQSWLGLEKNIGTLRTYGLEVGEDGYAICPGRLVLRAVSSEIGGEFCVASDDPLNQAEPYTRIAEVLRAATQLLMAQLDKDMHI